MEPKTLKNKRKVVFTGGGSGGHVFPNKPLVDYYKDNFDVIYIGTKNGVEANITKDWGIEYESIKAGKLRRYFDLKNFVDVLSVGVGFVQSLYLIFKHKPVFIFSKGGFVAVPVCVAARVLRVPVYIHEADMTPGLANRICAKFATHVFLTFKPKNKPTFKYTVSGLPLRSELYLAEAARGRDFLGIQNEIKPILLILGGSLGSSNINNVVRKNIDKLLETFVVVHSTGLGKLDGLIEKEGYIQKEFIGAEIFDCIKAADVVVSRAGAGGLMELLALQKPTLFIPLGLDQSRGDQIENCEYIKEKNVGKVLMEGDMDTETFIENVLEVYKNREVYARNIKKLEVTNPVEKIVKTIKA